MRAARTSCARAGARRRIRRTTLIDHHASPDRIDGSLDICADAIVQSGLRVCECYEVTDRNGPAGAAAGIAENVRFAKQLARQPNPLLAASFGLHASFTVGPETLERSVAEAKSLGLGFHVHVAEDNADETDSETKHGQRVGEHLHEKGVLGEKTLSAHCVHVNQNEINLLAKTNTKVSHQPRSNMNNAVGTAPVQQMLSSGVCVGLGNDGFSNNMYSEMKAAYLVHESTAGDPRAIPGDTVTRLAYENNARIASLFWPRPIGVIEPGAYADLVFLDYRPYTPLTAGNLPWQIIFGVDGTHVTTTIVGGKVADGDHPNVVPAHTRWLLRWKWPHGVFASAVNGQSFSSGHPGDGGVIYDDPATLFQHHRYFVYHGQPDALEVGIHHFVKDLLGRPYHPGHDAAYSGIVERDIQTAAFFHGLLHHVFNL